LARGGIASRRTGALRPMMFDRVGKAGSIPQLPANGPAIFMQVMRRLPVRAVDALSRMREAKERKTPSIRGDHHLMQRQPRSGEAARKAGKGRS